MAMQLVATATPSATDHSTAHAGTGGTTTTTVVAQVPGQVVTVSGRLDARTVPDVRTALHEAVDHGSGDLVVEVHDIVVADATGLGVFVGAHRRAQRTGRRLVLRGVPLPALRLLRVTRLHRVLVVEGQQEALATIRRERAQALAGRAHGTRPTPARSTSGGRGQNSRELTSSMPRKAS